jgi:hypothetical protein
MILIFVCGLIVSPAKLSLELVVSRIWNDWQQALIVVKPETVIKWHRQGFKMYWRWKSRSSQVRRPKLDKRSGI